MFLGVLDRDKKHVQSPRGYGLGVSLLKNPINYKESNQNGCDYHILKQHRHHLLTRRISLSSIILILN